MDSDRSETIPGLNKTDVIAFEDAIVKVEQFDTKVANIAINQSIVNAFNQGIMTWQRFAQAANKRHIFNWLEGVDCEVLRAGNPQWQKGKLKLKIQFEFDFQPDNSPEGTDSPLDEIRQMINGKEV